MELLYTSRYSNDSRIYTLFTKILYSTLILTLFSKLETDVKTVTFQFWC